MDLRITEHREKVDKKDMSLSLNTETVIRFVLMRPGWFSGIELARKPGDLGSIPTRST